MRTPFVVLLQTALFVVGLTTVDAFAQGIAIKPQLRPGDEFRLEVTRIRGDSTRPEQNGRSRTVVDVRVFSATPEGFVLDWAPGETVLENPAASQDPMVAIADQVLRGIVFRLTLNADGALTGLANQAEVAPKLKTMLETIVKNLSERLSENERKSFQNVAEQILSPAGMISGATRDAEIYFGMYGVSLAVGESGEASLQQPNPLGGGAVQATYRLEMESATADSASLKRTTTYDAEALQRTTRSFLQQSGGPIPPEEFARIPPMQMGDEGKYVFDRNLGLMREVIVNRSVSIGNMRRNDGWQIRMLSAPKR